MADGDENQDQAPEEISAKTAHTVPLGCTGVIRLRAATRVRLKLEPTENPFVIDKLTGDLTLKGTADNLGRKLRARLTWLVSPQRGEKRRIPHGTEVALISSGPASGKLAHVPFEVREIVPHKDAKPGEETLDADHETLKALSWDVLKLGLCGVGQVGFRIEPRDPAVPACEIAPADSGVSLNIPLDVYVLDGHTQVELDAAALRVGSSISVRVVAGQMFKDRHVGLELWESEKPLAVLPDGTLESVSGYTRHWQLGSEHVETFRLGAEGQLWYSNDLSQNVGLSFRYRLRLTDDQKAPIKDAKPLAEGMLATVPSPNLTTWTIAYQAPSGSASGATPTTFTVAGHIENLAKDLDLHLEATLFSLVENQHALSGKKIAARSEPVAIHTATEQSGVDSQGSPGDFSAPIHLNSEGEQFLVEHDDAQFFAVLSLPVGDAVRSVFAEKIAYEPNMKDDGKDTGFAPFEAGDLSVAPVATGVCTNAADLKGHETILESSGAWVPENRREAFNVVLSTIYGESGGQSEGAWRAIAHVIMNRAGKGSWAKYPNPEDIVMHTGFDAYSHREREHSLYSKAWSYLTGSRNPLNKKIEKMAAIVAPVFMGREETNDPTHGANFYYSPKAQAQLHKTRGYKEVPDWVSSGRTERIYPDGVDPKDDFAFYRSK